VFHDKPPTRDRLGRVGVPLHSLLCVMYNNFVKNVSHLFIFLANWLLKFGIGVTVGLECKSCTTTGQLNIS